MVFQGKRGIVVNRNKVEKSNGVLRDGKLFCELIKHSPDKH
jgi:hypothetical protein